LDLEGPGAQIDPAFDAETSEKLVKRMTEISQRKKDAFAVYNDKVILNDYHCFVEFDMYFQLVRDRLQGQWYRHSEQLSRDLREIIENSKKYNGPDHAVTLNAIEIVDYVEAELFKIIDPQHQRRSKARANTKQTYNQFIQELVDLHRNEAKCSSVEKATGKLSVVIPPSQPLTTINKMISFKFNEEIKEEEDDNGIPIGKRTTRGRLRRPVVDSESEEEEELSRRRSAEKKSKSKEDIKKP